MTRRPLSERALRERKTHRRLLRSIYGLCGSGTWRLRYAPLHHNLDVAEHVGKDLGADGFLWNSVGCTDPDSHVIYVDYRFDVLATFIHECLHVLVDRSFLQMHREEEEREVQRLEKLIMRHLTPRQAKRIHTDMARMLHIENDDLDPDDFDD